VPPPYPNPANRRPPAERARRTAWSFVFWGLGCIGLSVLATLFSYQQAKDALQYTSSDVSYTVFWQPAVIGLFLIGRGLWTLGKPHDMLEAEQPPAE
jgi:hypothetical protein